MYQNDHLKISFKFYRLLYLFIQEKKNRKIRYGKPFLFSYAKCQSLQYENFKKTDIEPMLCSILKCFESLNSQLLSPYLCINGLFLVTLPSRGPWPSTNLYLALATKLDTAVFRWSVISATFCWFSSSSLCLSSSQHALILSSRLVTPGL